MAEQGPQPGTVPQQEEQPPCMPQTAREVDPPRSSVDTKPGAIMIDDRVEIFEKNNARIKWRPGPTGDEEFTLCWWTDETDKKQVTTKAYEYTLTRLKTGEKYFVNIVVSRKSLESVLSNTVEFYTAPKPPTELTVIPYEHSPKDSLLIQFKNINTRQMAHKITVQPVEGESTDETVEKGKNFVLVKGLTPGQNYQVQIKAIDDDEDGELESESTIFGMVQTYPAAPTIADPQLIENNRLRLVWEKLAIRPNRYRVYCNERNDYTETHETSYNMDNLRPSTNYVFSVTAVNEAGESEKSRQKEFKTAPAPVSNLRVIGNPDAPTKSFIVTFGYPIQQGIRFRVVAELKDGTEVESGETGETRYTFRKLDPGRSYFIYVVTICDDKESKKLYFVR